MRFLPTVLLLVLTLAANAAPPLSQPLPVAGPRRAGPLSLSLQNEVDAAIARGRTWLLAQQRADGSWGKTNDGCGLILPTALAVQALLHDPSPDQRQAAQRGCRWLWSHWTCVTGSVVGSHWYCAALTLRTAAAMDPALSSGPHSLPPLPEKPASPYGRMLLNELGIVVTNAARELDMEAEVLSAMPSPGAAPTPAARALLPGLATWWQQTSAFRAASDAQQRARYARADWAFALFINRAGGGTLANAAGHVIDWRTDLAQALVAAQISDEDGHGGCWMIHRLHPTETERALELSSSINTHPVITTAYALLALDEL